MWVHIFVNSQLFFRACLQRRNDFLQEMVPYRFEQSITSVTNNWELVWVWSAASIFWVSVLQRCRAWLEKVKHLWHPSVLLTWLCVWAQFNHCTPTHHRVTHPVWLRPSTQIILHFHVIPSCRRRIKMFSAVRYFYPPTGLSVNYSKYSYIKIKPSWIGGVQQAALPDSAVMVKSSQWDYLHMCVPTELVILSWAGILE